MTAARPQRGAPPTLRLERLLFAAGHRVVAGVDEVGRGALAGPVSVGIACIDATAARVPAGLRDSKELRPVERERLLPRLQRWTLGSAVGHAAAAEIDRFGLLAALRLAAVRALTELGRRGVIADILLLDGNYDYLHGGTAGMPVVRTEVGGDRTCACIAAASVLAKTVRDARLRELCWSHPGYGLCRHKGYATAEHQAALRDRGPCPEHRVSWRLPTGVIAAGPAGGSQ